MLPAQNCRKTVAICFRGATIPPAGHQGGTRTPGRFAGSLHTLNASPFLCGSKMIRRAPGHFTNLCHEPARGHCLVNLLRTFNARHFTFAANACPRVQSGYKGDTFIATNTHARGKFSLPNRVYLCSDSFVSAFFQPCWNCCCALAASAVLPCALRLSASPKNERALFGLRFKSSRNTASASVRFARLEQRRAEWLAQGVKPVGRLIVVQRVFECHGALQVFDGRDVLLLRPGHVRFD